MRNGSSKVQNTVWTKSSVGKKKCEKGKNEIWEHWEPSLLVRIGY